MERSSCEGRLYVVVKKGEGKKEEKSPGTNTVDRDTYRSRRVRSRGKGAKEAVGRPEEFSKLASTVKGAKDKVKIDMMAKDVTGQALYVNLLTC